MSNLISKYTLEVLPGSKPINYGSVMYMYGWIMEVHQPNTFPPAKLAQDYIVHRSLD